jgi:hypothetical protein
MKINTDICAPRTTPSTRELQRQETGNTSGTKNKLITALRLTAHKIENRLWDYSWSNMDKCNCGLLVCALNNEEPDSIHKKIFGLGGLYSVTRQGLWSGVANFCINSGKPNNEIISSMFAAKLSCDDIIQLENLSNPKVVSRIGSSLQRSDACDVVKYMRAWADVLLEEQQAERGSAVSASLASVDTQEPNPSVSQSLKGRYV